jgi:hypothetical protein
MAAQIVALEPQTNASIVDEFRSRLKARAEFYAQFREDSVAWAAVVDDVEHRFAAVFTSGTSIVLCLATFDFVHAPSRTAALKAFVRRFGQSASGWAFDVNRPMLVGGGACPR